MTSNNEAANALMKLKKPKAKRGPKPKPRPNSSLSAKELNNKYRVETAIVGSRSNKPKNNNNKNKKAASNFLQSLFTPRKNVKK
jgi:hypothetical protein